MSAKEEDYYLNEKGHLVFTASFLKRRGYCCGNGCLHCPYDYEGVRDKNLQQQLKSKMARNSQKR